MKLSEVEYEAPASIAEAVDLLAEHQDEASVLAGGQSLILMLAVQAAGHEQHLPPARILELIAAANAG